ncbi:MAG: dTMP kinase [Halieaceae bacterium]|jgi:dTMP kinase
MAKKGLFITMEGGEGVGKSTNIAVMRKLLEQRGIAINLTREPGGTKLAERLRDLLLEVSQETVDPISELLMLFAARRQHLCEVILPAIDAGTWVISDRFTDATYAYQGAGRGMSANLIAQLESIVQGERRPDYTFLLDAPVSTGMRRAQERGELDRFEREKLAFFERVRSNYLQRAAAEPRRFRIINAEHELAVVQADVETQFRPVIERWLEGDDATGK